MVAVTGCSKVDGTAPSLGTTTIESANQIGGRTELLIKGEDGESLAVTQWAPKAPPVALVLAVHGYGDYGPSTFDSAARDWADRGILSYAYDQRGFGRNPSNGDWPGADRLIEDAGAVAAILRRRHPELPMTLVGHSMGGAVATASAGENLADVDQVVLLAPALWGGDNLNPFLRAFAGSANFFAPNKRWSGDGIVRIQASDNLPMLRALGRDPLYVRNPSSREFVGLIRLMDRAVAAAPLMTQPALVVFGAKDEVVPEEPIQEAINSFQGPVEYRKIETGWHMLLRDLQGMKVRDLVAEFILKAQNRT